MLIVPLSGLRLKSYLYRMMPMLFPSCIHMHSPIRLRTLHGIVRDEPRATVRFLLGLRSKYCDAAVGQKGSGSISCYQIRDAYQ